MQPRRRTSSLIKALHELYHRIYEIELFRRIHSYRKNIGMNSAYDITDSLTRHIEKLAVENKPVISMTPAQPTSLPLTETKPHPINKVSNPPTLVQKVIDGFSKYVKVSAHRKETDYFMGDKLKASAWSHIHAAALHARNGELETAKLHVGIASQAVKEASHYMTDEDYHAMCEEVEKVLSEVKEIKS